MFSKFKQFKIQIILFLVFIVLFPASLQIGSLTQISDDDANAFVQEFLSQKKEIDAMEIFLKNSTVLLPMFIPGFGVAWGLYSAWSTGFGFAALVSMAPGLASTAPLSILFLTPYGIMELIAYSLGLSCSVYLTIMLIKRAKLRPLVKPIIIEIGVAVGLLLAGGFVENYIIKLAQ